jgi:hypothetical protein
MGINDFREKIIVGEKIYCQGLNHCGPLEYDSFFLGGKNCRKIVNIGVMRMDRAAQQRLFSGTILRGLPQPLNAYGYKYLSLFRVFMDFFVQIFILYIEIPHPIWGLPAKIWEIWDRWFGRKGDPNKQ